MSTFQNVSDIWSGNYRKSARHLKKNCLSRPEDRHDWLLLEMNQIVILDISKGHNQTQYF